MKANELRIGNYFIVNWSKEVRRADCLDIRDIAESRITDGVSGVTLTPEILEKCGFKKSLIDDANPDEGVYYSLDLSNDKYCDLLFIEGDKNGFMEVCLFPYTDTFRYKYLHQLQNLYFALTGEELDGEM